MQREPGQAGVETAGLCLDKTLHPLRHHCGLKFLGFTKHRSDDIPHPLFLNG
jgi:hypothetical protein